MMFDKRIIDKTLDKLKVGTIFIYPQTNWYFRITKIVPYAEYMNYTDMKTNDVVICISVIDPANSAGHSYIYFTAASIIANEIINKKLYFNSDMALYLYGT